MALFLVGGVAVLAQRAWAAAQTQQTDRWKILEDTQTKIFAADVLTPTPTAGAPGYTTHLVLDATDKTTGVAGHLEPNVSGATPEAVAAAPVVGLALLDGATQVQGGTEPVSGLAFSEFSMHFESLGIFKVAPDSVDTTSMSPTTVDAIALNQGGAAGVVAGGLAGAFGLPSSTAGEPLTVAGAHDGAGNVTVTVRDTATGAAVEGAAVTVTALVAASRPLTVDDNHVGGGAPGWVPVAAGATDASGAFFVDASALANVTGPVAAVAGIDTRAGCTLVVR